MARPVDLGVDAGAPSDAARRWGNRSALSDDNEARALLIAAASRCIIRRGTADIRMAEVADEAGVVRSTLYRYFATRDDLLKELVVYRADRTFGRIARELVDPDDAARSLPDLILVPVGMVPGNPLNEALYSPGSRALVTAVGLESELTLDALERHWGPLLARWQSDGQLHADLGIRETVRWMNAIGIMLLMPPWPDRSLEEKREFLDRYLVRALVRPEPS